MAKDDPNLNFDEPERNADNADDVRPAEEEKRAPDAGEKTVPNLLESTIESIDEVDADEDERKKRDSDVGEKTVPNVLESTVESLGGRDSDAGEMTVPNVLESTIGSVEAAQQPNRSGKVRPGASHRKRKDEHSGDNQNLFETIDPFGINAAEKTVDALDIDQTLELDGGAAGRSEPGGADIRATQETTVAGLVGRTIDLTLDFDETSDEYDTQEFASPLDSPDVGRTINPRELSAKDAELWDSLAVSKSAHGQPTKNIPAIERSFTETKLQIRPRQVVTPKQGPETPSDYRLIRLLGKGGMGNVFIAKQESLDRMIAVKVIKPLDQQKRTKLAQTGRLKEVEADRRHQFLSEAVVTGDLDHPNIVPIYDIAVTADDSLFYAMKRVVGTPWSNVINQKTLDENLDILLKVCDAVGFAHTRGVVHRDIKPENIMLGDFGIVMVMDWGLALAKPDFEKIDSIAHTAGLGGTPAFMAPEMATGPIEKISPASDIYLLGATLFQIITGTPPHQAENVSACIRAVTTNKIREVGSEHHGELLNISLKAMATRQQDRFPDVISFQEAIREYRSHAESITLASRAREDLRRGQQNRDYKDLSRATFGFEEAIALWTGNEVALQGLAETKLFHAEAAYENGDYDLGLSILDPGDEAHQPTIHKLEEGLREREQRNRRLVLFKRAIAAMLAFILVGGSVALYMINDQRKQAQANLDRAIAGEKAEALQRELAEQNAEEAKKNADTAEKNAEIARENAELAREEEAKAKALKQLADANAKEADANAKEAMKQTKLAEERQKEAETEREEAETQRKNAVKSAQEALAQTQIAEYEVYLSQIGLAKARIERNEFDDARRILAELKTKRGTQNLGWEWRWLWRQAHQSQSADRAKAAAIDLAINRSGQSGAVVLDDGSVELISLLPSGTIATQSNHRLPKDAEATTVAISADEQLMAFGTRAGEIQIWTRDMSQLISRLAGHDDRITDLRFSPTGMLVSGSTDRTARIWNPSTGEPLASCWHIAPVRQLAVAERDGEVVLVTAVADSSTGRAVVWRISGSTAAATAERNGEFLQHDQPVSSIAISPQGDVVASGDAAGNILVWRPTDVGKTDYAGAIISAVREIKGEASSSRNKATSTTPAIALVDTSDDQAEQLVSVQAAGPQQSVERLRAHDDIIESICFSEDGRQLLSTSDDYTLKLWELDSQSLAKTLRGHGSWVTDATFIAGTSDKIISVSRDATIRVWDSSSYVGAASMLTRQSSTTNDAPSTSQPHADEIWSASFDPGGQRIVSASRDHTARILQIDPQTMAFKEVARLQDTQREPTKLAEGTSFLAMSVVVDRPHGRLYIGSADSTVRIWNLALGTEISQATGTGLNNSLALSANGRLLLTGSSSPDIKAILWEVDPTGSVSPRQRFRLRGHDQAVTAFAISHDGSKLFTGDRVGIGIVWDANTGRQLERIEEIRGFRINAAAFTPSGDALWIAADDQQLSLIDLNRGERIDQFAHDGFVTQLSLSEDGNHALTVDELRTEILFQSTATLWNLRTNQRQVLDQVKRTLDRSAAKQRTAGQRINSAQFGSQSQLAIISRSAGETGELKVFSIPQSATKLTKPTRFALPGKIGPAQVALPISSRQMLTLNGDAAFLWDLQTMTHVKSYRAHAAVTQASFSFDGRFVATGSRSVKIWDAESGLSVSKLENPHSGPVRAVRFSPVGKDYVLATAGDDGVARVWTWDPANKTFNKIRELAVTKAGPNEAQDAASKVSIRSLGFSPDGQSLLTVGARGTVRLWRLHDSRQSSFDIDQPVTLTCGVVSPDNKWIAVGGDDKLARMWRISEAKGIPEPNQSDRSTIIFAGHADRIESIQILMDGSAQPRVLTASRDKSARVWDPRLSVFETTSSSEAREIVALRKHTQGVTAIDVTSDGNLVMTAGRDGTVILWPAAPREPASEQENVFDNL